MTSFENQYVTITVDESLQTLVHTWRGFAQGEDYRNAWEASLKLAQQHNLKRWLINQRDLKGISSRDLQWTNEEWVPKSKQAMGTMRYTAIVLSDNIFDEVVLNRSAQALREKGIIAGYFANEHFAKAWLQEC